MNDKFSKSEVHYSQGMIHSHCGEAFTDDKSYCRHYHKKTLSTGTCELVEGEIKPTMWCNKFKKVKA